MIPHRAGAAPAEAAARWGPRLRVAVRLALLVALLVALHEGGAWLNEVLKDALTHLGPRGSAWVLAVGVALFAVLLALPFVPGMELSLVLMMLFGLPAVGLVYGATLAALSAGFLVGRRVPLPWLAGLLGWLRLARGRALVERLAPLGGEARLALLLETAPRRLAPWLLRHRYLALMVVLNLPGNALIGGGGGIALLAGLSGLFRFPAYALAVAVAIAPIPVLLTVTETLPLWYL